MNRQEAELLAAALMAAWPWAQWPDATVALYRTELSRLNDTDVAREVVEELIRTAERPPSIATLRHDYSARCERVRHARARGRELPEPMPVPPSPEVVEQFRALGIDLSSLLKIVPGDEAGEETPAT